MTSVLTRTKQRFDTTGSEDTEKGEDHMTKEADWSDGAISQGLPTATRSWKKQRPNSPLEPTEGAWPCQHLDFELLASRTVRE